jgi:hypothetical protein
MEKRLHKNGKVYLVNTNDRKVFFIDEDAIFNTVTRAAFYHDNNLVISNSAIQAAKRILKDEHGATPSNIYLRVGFGAHHYWIDFADGVHFIAYSERGAFFGSRYEEAIRCIDVDFFRPPETGSIPPLPVADRTRPPTAFGTENRTNRADWLARQYPHLEKILSLTNIPENLYSTVITWIICSLFPEENQFLLEIVGEEHSGKSTTASIIKSLIDPSVITLEEAPSSRKELLSLAQNRYIIAIDNADDLSNSMQQTIYELITKGISHRTNHGNSANDWTVNLRNPVISVSMSSMLTNRLLLKKSITINLPNLKSIRPDQSIIKDFADCQPQALLELATIAANTLRKDNEETSIQESRLYIDNFILMGFLVCESLGINKDEFIRNINDIKDEITDNLLDESIVAKSLHLWAIKNPSANIERPINYWHKELIKNLPEEERDQWPGSPRKFGSELKKIAAQIKKKGIICKSLGKQGSHHYWRIKTVETLQSAKDIDDF